MITSSCHVEIGTQSDTPAGAVPTWTDLLAGYAPAQSNGPVSLVSITALTTEPTPAELNAFSKKGAMAWDIWPAADIYTHYHVGSLEDADASWVLKPWSGQAGPQVDMVLGSAVSDANLTQWTEPKVAWPTEPKALMTGNLVRGAGVRWLESQDGRAFGDTTGVGLMLKATRDTDSPNAGELRKYATAYAAGAISLVLGDEDTAFPSATTRGERVAPNVPPGVSSVAGDTQHDTIAALGLLVDDTGAYEQFAAGVSVSGASAAQALVQTTRIALMAHADTMGAGTLVANALVQEGLALNRLSVGDEWLTYSNNLGVDPRLIFGMEGIDSGGALQHVWSMAYLDIATQKVPDIHDDQDLADALDVQGDPATAAQILPIGEDGKPVYSSFSADYSADYNQ